MDVSRSPKEVVLEQNYPNPFNPTTQIRFYLPSEANVALTVYNVAGQEVRTLANDMLPVGEHVVTWDGRDNVGNTVSTGVYFYKLISGNTTHIRKMVMLK